MAFCTSTTQLVLVQVCTYSFVMGVSEFTGSIGTDAAAAHGPGTASGWLSNKGLQPRALRECQPPEAESPAGDPARPAC